MTSQLVILSSMFSSLCFLLVYLAFSGLFNFCWIVRRLLFLLSIVFFEGGLVCLFIHSLGFASFLDYFFFLVFLVFLAWNSFFFFSVFLLAGLLSLLFFTELASRNMEAGVCTDNTLEHKCTLHQMGAEATQMLNSTKLISSVPSSRRFTAVNNRRLQRSRQVAEWRSNPVYSWGFS
jgi:hypothetical protein